jgi:hypothetical protein
MHRSRLGSFWIDVPSDTFEATRRFWTEGVGYTGRDATEYPGTYYMLGTLDHIQLGIQPIGTDDPEHSSLRWHMDFEAGNGGARDIGSSGAAVEARVDQLVAAGARVDARLEGWTRLVDPAGLPCCVIPGKQRGVYLDVPEPQFAAVSTFWCGALGRTLTDEDDDEGQFWTMGDSGAALSIGIQRLQSGDARLHVDIESDDVEAEVARLEALGARRTEKVETWWKLVDPGGQEFCVTEVQTDGFADATTWP